MGPRQHRARHRGPELFGEQYYGDEDNEHRTNGVTSGAGDRGSEIMLAEQ
jgi:hypothetical protein